MNELSVGRKIKQYREYAGISQERLAEILDISVCAVSNLERGINYPTMENFIKLANALGVSADALLEDVLEVSELPKTSILSEKLKGVSAKKRQQILEVIDILLKSEA